MVVDLSVYGQHLFAIWREKRLSARFGINDREALMGQDGRAAAIDSTPVGSAMTDFLTHAQGFLPQRVRLFCYIEYSYDSTHNDYDLIAVLIKSIKRGWGWSTVLWYSG